MRHKLKFGLTEVLDCLLAVAIEDDDALQEEIGYYRLEPYAGDEFIALCEDFGIHVHACYDPDEAWLSWSAVKKLASKLWPRGKRGRRNKQGDLFKDLFLMLAWNDAAYKRGIGRVKDLFLTDPARQQHMKEKAPL